MMTSHPNTAHSIQALKQLAKRKRRIESTQSYISALDAAAREIGYRDYTHAWRSIASGQEAPERPLAPNITRTLTRLNDVLKSRGLRAICILCSKKDKFSSIYPDAPQIPGLYVLFFSDGAIYIGETIQGRADQRFREHKSKTFRDIIGISYSPAPEDLSARRREELYLKKHLLAEGFAVRMLRKVSI